MVTTITFQSQTRVPENSKHLADTAKEPQQLSPDLIRIFLEVSPEMQEIDDLVDSKCYTLHKKEKLDCFSALFKKIIAMNKKLFSSKTTPEKANMLYKFHSDEIVLQIIHSEKLPSIVESFFQRLEDPYKTQEIKRDVISETIKKLYERISYLHSGYVRFATAAALKVSVKDLPCLSYTEDTLEGQELKKPSNLDIYSQ